MIGHLNGNCAAIMVQKTIMIARLPILNLRFISFKLAIACLLSCSSRTQWKGECYFPHDIGTIEIVPNPGNALRLGIKVQTEAEKDVYIQYWENEVSDTLVSNLSNNSDFHTINLVNVKPKKDYNFRIVVQDEYCKTFSQTYKFTSNNLPPWVPYYPKKDSLDRVNFSGYFHFHSRKKPGYLFLADDSGEVLWYQRLPLNVKVSKWTDNKTFLTILSEDTLQFSSGKHVAEFDLNGEILFSAKTGEGQFDQVFHHEISYNKEGNIMTLVYENRLFDLSKHGGQKQDTVKGDGILVFNKVGDVLWKWSVFDVESPYNYPEINKKKDDWLHANAMVRDDNGDYLISFRNISEIWKINGKTGALVWKLGGENDEFGLSPDKKFSGQHNIHFDKYGHLVVLDNGNKKFSYGPMKGMTRAQESSTISGSRMLVFKLNESKRTAKLIRAIDFPDHLYTASQGSIQQINDDLLLFSSSSNNLISFVDANNGKVLGSIPVEYQTYRTQYIKQLYKTDFVK